MFNPKQPFIMEYKTSIKFYLSEKLTLQGTAPIYMRIITDRDKKELLVAKVPPHEWIEAKQRTKRNAEVNLMISDLERKARRIQMQLEDEELPVTARILKDYLTGRNKAKTFLIEYFYQFICEKNDNPKVSPNTLVLYRQTLDKIRKFVQAEFKTTDILIKEVNYKFLERFQYFLFRQNLKANTVERHHSRFRTLLHQGRKEGKINLNPLLRNT
jgi:integrase/recombinase XerD